MLKAISCLPAQCGFFTVSTGAKATCGPACLCFAARPWLQVTDFEFLPPLCFSPAPGDAVLALVPPYPIILWWHSGPSWPSPETGLRKPLAVPHEDSWQWEAVTNERQAFSSLRLVQASMPVAMLLHKQEDPFLSSFCSLPITAVYCFFLGIQEMWWALPNI